MYNFSQTRIGPILFCAFILVSFPIRAQEKVSFLSGDGLKLTADLYMSDHQSPFIILLHQAESSRGEYASIAPKLMKLGYNCLAVDLRSGNKINYIQNESALRAKNNNKSDRFIDARLDIEAAINFIDRYNQNPIILFGSSYSASLALLLANKFAKIEAVVAFSPGEYFRPEIDVRKEIAGFSKPVFIGTTEIEYSYTKELLSEVKDSYKTMFKPSKGRGVHGAKALWEDSPGSKECWFQLTYFFGILQEI